MRRENAVFCLQQWIVTPDELCADHIQPRCINLSTIQRISQIPLHDQSPAAVVDQDHAILPLGNILSVDDIDYLEPRIDVGKNGKMQL